MNLAIGALVIILLLLPAFFFRIGISSIRLQSGKEAEKGFTEEIIRRNLATVYNKLSFSEVLFLFSIVPVVLHLVSLFIITQFYWIDYRTLLDVISGKDEIEITRNKDFLFNSELLSFLKYIVFESLIAAVLGWLFAYLVLQSAGFLLRVLIGDNIWFQLFTGALLTNENRKQVDVVQVDVYCSIKEGSVIYSGVLQKFDITRD